MGNWQSSNLTSDLKLASLYPKKLVFHRGLFFALFSSFPHWETPLLQHPHKPIFFPHADGVALAAEAQADTSVYCLLLFEKSMAEF